ncbi:hypothetical protein Ocin01_07657 [Orchesella cincta]|uniref:Uncharacterized protein n=1 Tax=Orchesella cincta TaxID=48709 RepID=A0A1D2N2A0_ORCCI|nr:hypothetical protein Ocin01_07657 [Orchesella cincta]
MFILASFRFMYHKILGWGWNLCFWFPRSILNLITACWIQHKIRGRKRLARNLPGFGKIREAELARERGLIFFREAVENIRWQQTMLRDEDNLFLVWESFLFDCVEREELNIDVVMVRMRPISEVYEAVMLRNENFHEKYNNAILKVLQEAANWKSNPPKCYFSEKNGMTKEELQAHLSEYYEESEKWAADVIQTFTDIRAESNQLVPALIVQLRRCIRQLLTIRYNAPRTARRG